MSPAIAVRRGTWQAINPVALDDCTILAEVEQRLDDPGTLAELRSCDEQECYPAAAVEALKARGVARLFADPPGSTECSIVTAIHLNALNATTARRSGSLAITLGVNALALLPVYIAGSRGQWERVRRRVHEGASAALLLTEREHGSDLLANRTTAKRGAGHYRVTGEKYLINGGSRADLLVTQVRTGPLPENAGSGIGSTSGLSLLLIERDASVRVVRRERTLPVAAADIASVRFEGTEVPVEALIGKEGEGFSLLQKALSVSRGGISALASGACTQALELATEHARRRVLYGRSILAFDAIADHLARLAAFDLLVGAMSVKAAALVNAYGLAAAYYTAAAKLSCCDLAEKAVDEGRRVLGAQALASPSPYARLVRDVLLYQVFDGTRHVMLEHLQSRLALMAVGRDADPGCTAAVAAAYRTPARPLPAVLRLRERPLCPPVTSYATALCGTRTVIDLEPLRLLAVALLEVTCHTRRSGAWERSQALRFSLAEILAHLETLVATAELADAGMREALGMAPAAWSLPEYEEARSRFALSWFGARICARLRTIALRTVGTVSTIDKAERIWVAGQERAWQDLVEHLRADPE